MASPVAEALTRCREVFTQAAPDSLVWDLPLDAVLVRARSGEATACVPRLLELAVNAGQDEPRGAAGEAMAAVAADRHVWDQSRSLAVDAVLDAWWATACRVHPYPPGIDEILAALARFEAPLVRWLRPWLEQFDGPGIEHFVDLVVGGLDAPAWIDHPDTRSQILAWTRSEPVVMGVTLVGGPHLDRARFSSVLDRILDPDDGSTSAAGTQDVR